MQVVNDYDKEVFNGDLGLVRTIDLEAGELVVEFDGREVAYDFGELDELVLAYATTIHKAQGSEYPAVVIPVTTQHYPMLQRNLLYTAVTRGKQLVVLVAQPKALAIAVKGQLRAPTLVEAAGVARRRPTRTPEARWSRMRLDRSRADVIGVDHAPGRSCGRPPRLALHGPRCTPDRLQRTSSPGMDAWTKRARRRNFWT